MTSDRSCLEPSEAVRRNRAEDFGLDLSGFSPQDLDDLTARFATGTMGAFTDTLAKVGYCSRPVQLVGSSATADKATGEVLGTYSSRDAPLGVTYVACGNRRASVCAACSRLYAADTFQMLRAGVAGGKQVPEHVRDNPLLFVTLTAPSFGAVHRASSGQAGCRPEAGRPRCRHGASQSCRRHDDEGVVGSPLCPGCYDYTTHVVWQWHAPELWRRFVIRLRRRVAHLLGVRESKLGSVATVQYAKVAEYQVRGAVHFHALIRLDGPRTAEGFAPAPADLDCSALAAEVRCAARDVSYLAPATGDDDAGRLLRFGRQLDVRVVRASRRDDDPDAALSAEQVAGYIAKYATKGAGDTVFTGPRDHYDRLIAVARRIGSAARRRADARREAGQVEPDDEGDPYERLADWSHTLAFRGHFSTKSRRYSVTLGKLRRARRRWQVLAAQSRATGVPIDIDDLEHRLLADEEETTLVIGSWQFAGLGWATEGDAALAVAAAARAREYAAARAAHRH
ncbi:replication initiator [Mobilicoccus caccae]|uniref:Replication initiation protein n=1 Tax=Mobilicoccus caccae TaxID=1859295 RepID=A0ABQ6IVS1_9MICO|nr:replication initiator [Mobilicoccus caccae]GMA40814.1 replication initiation protein [Mobilicoccus caccae]